MKTFYTLLLCCLVGLAHSQATSFEGLNLPVDTFVNNAEGPGFTFNEDEGDEVFLPNSYNATYMSFSDFAISTMTDTETAGFTNQYSVISGSGANESLTYAVGFAGFGETYIKTPGGTIGGFYVNNTTYAALSMRDGDTFAKKFGGETGDDPDFFLMTIKYANEGIPTGDSINFYLADYRFEDNNLDYIVEDWTYIEITSGVSEIIISLSSSDNGAFGMNTPAYFAIDDMNVFFLNTKEQELLNANIFPNPVDNILNIEVEQSANVDIYSIEGTLVHSERVYGNAQLHIEHLFSGAYYVNITTETKAVTKKMIKK